MLIFIMNITGAYTDTLHELSLIASTEQTEISIFYTLVTVRFLRFNAKATN